MKTLSSILTGILAHVPCKCCRIRNENGVYRVYKYKAIKLPSGKWSNDYGYLMGKILPDKGFVANKRYLKELEKEWIQSSAKELQMPPMASIHC